jgi:hypothetical protein
MELLIGLAITLLNSIYKVSMRNWKCKAFNLNSKFDEISLKNDFLKQKDYYSLLDQVS